MRSSAGWARAARPILSVTPPRGRADPRRRRRRPRRPARIALASTRAAGGELIPAGLGPDARPYADTGGPPDGKRDLVQGDDAPVSARLRPAVTAYFEAVSRLAAERPPATK